MSPREVPRESTIFTECSTRHRGLRPRTWSHHDTRVKRTRTSPCGCLNSAHRMRPADTRGAVHQADLAAGRCRAARRGGGRVAVGAEREKRAKIISAEGESLAASALGDASDTMMAPLQLRNLQTSSRSAWTRTPPSFSPPLSRHRPFMLSGNWMSFSSTKVTSTPPVFRSFDLSRRPILDLPTRR